MTTFTALPRLSVHFWRYWAGLLCTALGDAVVYIALPFLVLIPAHPAGTATAQVGLVVLAGSLPRFLAPLLGLLADRLPPRTLLMLAGGLRALPALLAGLAALRSGTLPLWSLMLLAGLNGLLATVSYTAGSAMLPRLVPPALLPRANALVTGALQGGPLLGYGLGGALLALVGGGSALLLAAGLTLGLTLGALGLPGQRPQRQATPEGLGALFTAAFRLYVRSPLLLALLAFSFLLNLLLNVMNVRAPVHMAVAGRGAPDYAVFEVLISGGMLLGVALMAALPGRLGLDRLIGGARWGVLAGLMGLLPDAVWSWWAGAAVFGLGLGVLEVAATTRIQGLVPDEVRGRVIGALMGVNAVGLLLGAGLAALPLPTATLLLGLLAALVGLALSWPLAVRAQRDREEG
ncbi:MFS transporter [Deinococcus sonorensis]|uniref:MFS transporter n=2 Tax=Deinococcus sonorensis TaxID=309891 RepID=A0AAU7UE31_9DEIO